MKQSIIYSLKVWISSALISPYTFLAIYTLYVIVDRTAAYPNYLDLLGHYLIAVKIFLLFTIIPWILMTLALAIVPFFRKAIVKSKFSIFVCVEVLILITHLIYSRTTQFNKNDLIMGISLALTTAIFIFYYKIEPLAGNKVPLAGKKVV